MIGITYAEEAGKYSYGLKMWDRPTGLADMKRLLSVRDMPDGDAREVAMGSIERDMRQGVFGLQRFFAGRALDGSLQVIMADSQGRARIRMVIDEDDNPHS